METRDRLQAVAVVIGLLTFLVLLHDRNYFLTSFIYETNGLRCEKEFCAIHVFIRNEGGTVEEGVEFEVPSALSKYTRIQVDRAYEIAKRGESIVLQLGPLHPGTRRHVTIFTRPGVSLAPVQAATLNIWSKSHSAVYNGSWEDEPWWFYWLGWATWIGMGYFALGLGYSLYVWLSPERRKKHIEGKIAEYEQQLAEVNELIAKRRAGS